MSFLPSQKGRLSPPSPFGSVYHSLSIVPIGAVPPICQTRPTGRPWSRYSAVRERGFPKGRAHAELESVADPPALAAHVPKRNARARPAQKFRTWLPSQSRG